MVTSEEGSGVGRDWEFGSDMYTLYLKYITNKDLLYITGSSAQCYVADWKEGSVGENGSTCMYG